MTYTEQTDLELIEALRNDDERALAELYNRYWKKILLVSLSKLNKPEIVEEIINDIFYDIWKSRHVLQVKTSVSHYIFAIAKYKIFAYFAQTKLKPTILQLENLELRSLEPISTDSSSDLVRFKECQRCVEEAIATLPDKCQLIFKLSRDEGLSIRQIATNLELSPKTVEGHISNALRKLRISLSNFVSLIIIFLLQ